ncbi:Rieske (2Fe-2S) protein [Alkalimonas collagenimarina]|uniref:Rieske (2Fe-2S) protein n=1 Tax=Alkalimonas collagenimarina TaxID=400390 RepID=A0ABT9H113_9GAMM|nr:Rieske (2Fe-2S) protein [Alkalimonas collagenimarina]MDP4536988.1 Rieske (2Fe-2S) protein [Alkalimonas collagenimarina]
MTLVQGSYHKATTENQLKEGKSMALKINGYNILLCKFDGQYYAFKNSCPHQSRPMTNAKIKAGKLICPLHGAQFNLSDGASLGSLTKRPLTSYDILVGNNEVHIKLPCEIETVSC